MTSLLLTYPATKGVRRLLRARPELRNHMTCHMISSSAAKLLISDGIPRLVSGKSDQRASAKGRSPEFSGFFINPAWCKGEVGGSCTCCVSNIIKQGAFLTFAVSDGARQRPLVKPSIPLPSTPPQCSPSGPAGSAVCIDLSLQSSQSGPLVVRAIDWSITHSWSIC